MPISFEFRFANIPITIKVNQKTTLLELKRANFGKLGVVVAS